MAVLGTVYSWSLYAQPLAAAFGWSASTTTWAFAAAIFFLGAGAVLGGRLQDRLGPRPVALAGAALWATGNLAAGLGTAALGAPWLYLTYGVVGGLGLGLAYVTPVATVTKWFPDRRGLGSGLVVAGFGLGAFLYNLVLRATPAFAAAAREAGEVLAARQAGGAATLSPASVEAVTRRPSPCSGPGLRRPRPRRRGRCSATRRRRRRRPRPRPSPGAAPAPGLAPPLPARPPARPARLVPGPTPSAPRSSGRSGPCSSSTSPPASSSSRARCRSCASSPAPRRRRPAAAYGLIALANAAGRFLWGAVSDRLGRRARLRPDLRLAGGGLRPGGRGSTTSPRWRRSSRWCCSATAAASAPCPRWWPTGSAPATSASSTAGSSRPGAPPGWPAPSSRRR